MKVLIQTFTALFVLTFLTQTTLAGENPDGNHLSQTWISMIESGNAYSSEELMPLFLKLKAIAPEEIYGTWHGGKFDGGLPDPINWYGKRFVSMEYVEPLLVTAPDGTIKPYTGLGSARLREVLFKNRVSTTLIYDRQPIIDYFRKVNEDLIIGWGEVKGDTPDFFFWLERVPAAE